MEVEDRRQVQVFEACMATSSDIGGMTQMGVTQMSGRLYIYLHTFTIALVIAPTTNCLR